MRAQYLQALARPIADLKALDERLGAFRRPAQVVTVVLRKVDAVEHALEAVSLGIAVAELVVGAKGADGEEDEP